MLAVVAMTDADTPIICNGFKDAEFIEMAMLAQKIGRKVIPVVEKYTELALILKYAEKVGVRPQIGMRIKLAARGSGRWQSSGGWRSKFGLTVSEILHAVDELKSRDMLDCFKLLHFHLGSQITNIRHVKTAVTEAARAYADLCKRGAGLEYLDIGGGLGVDYDGSQTNFESSVNYTLKEYANDVVHHVQAVCDEAGVPHPDDHQRKRPGRRRLSRCLVFGTLGVAGQGNGDENLLDIPPDSEQPLHDLVDTFKNVTARNVLESYHDAQQAMDVAMTLFSHRLSVARPAGPGRKPVLGHLPQDQAADRAARLRARGAGRARHAAVATRTSATSRCSSRCPTVGPSSSSFP